MRDLRHYRAKRDPARTPEPFGEEPAARALPPDAARAFVVQQHAARGSALGPAPRDRRRAGELGGAEGPEPRPEGEAPRGADRGPSARVRRLRGHHPGRQLRRRRDDRVGPRHLPHASTAARRPRASRRASSTSAARATSCAAASRWCAPSAARARAGCSSRRGTPARARRELVEREPALGALGPHRRGAARRAAALDAELAARRRRPGAPRARLPTRPRCAPMLADARRQAVLARGLALRAQVRRRARARREARRRASASSRAAARDAPRSTPESRARSRHLPVTSPSSTARSSRSTSAGASSFERLQQRFGRAIRRPWRSAQREIPVVFYAFDLLAVGGPRPARAAARRRARSCSRASRRAHGFVRFADHVEDDGVGALRGGARSTASRASSPSAPTRRYESGPALARLAEAQGAAHARCSRSSGSLPRQGLARARSARSCSPGCASGDAGATRGNVGSGLDRRSELDAARRGARRERRVAKPALRGPARALAARAWLRAARARLRGALHRGHERGRAAPAGVRARCATTWPPSDCAAPARRATRAARAAAPRPRRRAAAPSRARASRGSTRCSGPSRATPRATCSPTTRRVWPWLAPYLRDRPLVLTRYPDGIEGKCFYQKNAPEFTPDWVQRQTIDDTDYFVCNELRTLLYVVNSGAIPLHVWSARARDARAPRLADPRPRSEGGAVRRRGDDRAPHPRAARRRSARRTS